MSGDIDSLDGRETVRETKVENASVVVEFPKQDVYDRGDIHDAIHDRLIHRGDIEIGWVHDIDGYQLDVATDGTQMVAFIWDADLTIWDHPDAVAGPDEAAEYVLGLRALRVYDYDISESYTIERYD